MTTLVQVLANKQQVIDLAKQFGFSEEVKIQFEVPREGEEKFELRFIVKQASQASLSYKNSSWLAGKLSEVLDCEAHITDYNTVAELYYYDIDRKSALITDEKAIKEVIYRIGKDLSPQELIEESVLSAVHFEEIEYKAISKDDNSLYISLLKEADEYLKKKSAQTVSIKDTEAYGTHGLLSEKRKENIAEEASQKKPKLELKKEKDGDVVTLLIPIPKDAKYDESMMLNKDIADKLAQEYFTELGNIMALLPEKSS